MMPTLTRSRRDIPRPSRVLDPAPPSLLEWSLRVRETAAVATASIVAGLSVYIAAHSWYTSGLEKANVSETYKNFLYIASLSHGITGGLIAGSVTLFRVTKNIDDCFNLKICLSGVLPIYMMISMYVHFSAMKFIPFS